jgi:hypothetical protein
VWRPVPVEEPEDTLPDRVGKSSPVSGRPYAVMVLTKTRIRRAVRHASRSAHMTPEPARRSRKGRSSKDIDYRAIGTVSLSKLEAAAINHSTSAVNM